MKDSFSLKKNPIDILIEILLNFQIDLGELRSL